MITIGKEDEQLDSQPAKKNRCDSIGKFKCKSVGMDLACSQQCNHDTDDV